MIPETIELYSIIFETIERYLNDTVTMERANTFIINEIDDS